MNIFKHLDYISWLQTEARATGKRHGSKTRLAEAAGCQPSYLSLVLKKDAHLTLEQAERLCRFWQFDGAETEYFILLVNHARAGTGHLKAVFDARITEIKSAHENLTKRIKQVETFPDAAAGIYYSSWHYLAIHILISIPEFQTLDAISKRLEIDESAARKVLAFLEQIGFVESKTGLWKSTGRILHLPRESPFISLHHNHWRRKAVDRAFANHAEGIHYTAVNSLAKKDIEVIRQLVLHLIERSRAVILPSPEEEIICLNIDLFKI